MFETLLDRGVEPAKWLIVAGIAYTLATTIWAFFDTPVDTAVSPVAQRATTPARPAADVSWIVNRHLFGEVGAEPPPQAQTNEPAQQTRLPLELQSVVVDEETPERSSAIVAQRGKAGLRYRVGQTLPGNAKLEEVLDDRIILRRAGVRETLMFPKASTRFAVPEDEIAGAQAERGARTRTQAPSAQTNNQSDDGETDPAALVESYQERLATDPDSTLDELGIEAVDPEGAGGYRIGNVAQSPYLRNTGLQTGDVIVSVNGRAVGDVSQDQLELANILAQGSARIEVQRGTRRFFITASIPSATGTN